MASTNLEGTGVTADNVEDVLDVIFRIFARRCDLRPASSGEAILTGDGTVLFEVSKFPYGPPAEFSQVWIRIARTILGDPTYSAVLASSNANDILSRPTLEARKTPQVCVFLFGIILCSRIEHLSIRSDGFEVDFAAGLPFQISDLLGAAEPLLARLEAGLALPNASHNTPSPERGGGAAHR
jgi:hypothetical protein